MPFLLQDDGCALPAPWSLFPEGTSLAVAVAAAAVSILFCPSELVVILERARCQYRTNEITATCWVADISISGWTGCG